MQAPATYIRFRATCFRMIEWVRIVFCYYPNVRFFLTDISLCFQYFFKNPHRVSRAFLRARGAKELCGYGETPLTTMDRIARQCRILSKDVVLELGCGTGRTLFWLRHFVRCGVIGVDYLPTFIERANRVKCLRGLDWTCFMQGDMFETDLSEASVIYLYGTCLQDGQIERLIEQFKKLKRGVRVISVSYPLSDYSSDFRVVKQFEAQFFWGKADVYLNVCAAGGTSCQ